VGLSVDQRFRREEERRRKEEGKKKERRAEDWRELAERRRKMSDTVTGQRRLR
jgi:hypothetical protein